VVDTTADLQHKVLKKEVDGIEDTTDGKTATRQKIVDNDGNAAVVTSGGRLKVDADLTGGTVNVTATNLDIEDITITDVGTTDDSLKVKHTGDISIDSSTPISTSVSGNVSIDDSTPIDTAVTGTVTVNSTIQNSTLATKGKTSYSDSTSNVQYWLGLEEDNQLTLQYVDDSVSNQKTIFYALPSVSIDGSCLARRYYLADDEVTGEHTYIGTWTQTMNDRIKPPPTDITVTSGSLATVEDQVATTVLAGFSVTGGELPVTLSMTSNGGLNVELSGANLVVASGGIDGSASGSSPFTVGIRATDAFDVTYDENFSVTVTTNDITDIALSALEVFNDAVEGDDIGNLTCTGGVGDVSYAITSNGGLDNLKITDTGSSTATLEVDSGGIIDSTGTYVIRITVTDEVSQTYYEDFTITVLASFTDTKFLNFDTQTSNDYIDLGGIADFDDSDDFFFRRNDDDYTISWWMRFPTNTTENIGDVGNSSGDKQIFNTAEGSWVGHSTRAMFRDDKFVFLILTSGSHYGWWQVSSANGWMNTQDGNTWNHYAITYDSSLKVSSGQSSSDGVKFYRNGSLVSWDSYSSAGTWLGGADEVTNTSCRLRFGYPNYSSTGHINLPVATNDIAIWKSELSSSDISTIYNSGTPITVEGIDDSNLKRYYQFEDGDGTDSAGNYTATIGSAATVLEHYENTKHFDIHDKDASIEMPVFKGGDAYEIVNTDKSWTYGMWVKPDSSSASANVFQVGRYYPGASNGAVIYITRYNANTLRLKLFGANTSYQIAYYQAAGSPTLIEAGKWSHIMVTFRSASGLAGYQTDLGQASPTYDAGFIVYINGIRIPRSSGAATITWDLSGAEEYFTTGAQYPWTHESTNNYGAFLGQADNITVFNEEKSPSEVLAIYNEGHGKSHASDSSCKVWLRADSDTTGNLTDGGTITNSADNSTYPCTVDFLGSTSEITIEEY